MKKVVWCQEEFGDTKGVIGIRKSEKNRRHNGQRKAQKDKQRSTKHYTEN
jgi:predicted phosphoadenosine phosphosulfate sulfurtransferase